MKIEYNAKNKGFTLIELIIVIAIIAVLAAVAQPVYNKVIESAQRSVCLTQMNQMQKLFYYHLIEYPGGNMADALAGEYDDLTENFERHTCPSGGVYETDEYGNLVCSIHGGLFTMTHIDAEDVTGDTLPGTNLRIYDNYWPQPEDYEEDPNGNQTVEAGGVFEYEGVYYVVTQDIELTKGQAASGPGGDGWNWYAVQELTGNIVEFEDGVNQINGVTRGDIVQIGDVQYVMFVDGGTWAWNPEYNDTQWYEIPNDWEE